MKKILFVNPSIKSTVFGKMRQLALPPMGLGLLASRTPPDRYEVEIVDEAVETIDFTAEADLVAVTATTVQAPRAYEILRRFRRRGIPTILGGIHGSVMTEEASRFADCVVVGEADDLWRGILDDFDRGELQPLYRMREFPRMEGQPRIDRRVFGGKYFIPSVQTSRGCPCNCSFCSVTRFNGRRYRFRTVRDVIEELEQGQRWIYEATSTMGKSFTRGLKTLVNTRSMENAFTNFFWNYLNYRAINATTI